MSEAYKRAGVDVEAGYEAVSLMKEHVKRTSIPGVLSGIGGFGGLFELGQGYKNPVLVSGTDGVGTKLKIAFMMDKHDTVGQDCVAMCVNDIVCSGAKPLFFLDYIAVGKNTPAQVASIVKGIADGCVLAGCALIGGETAEMPGFYSEDEYDLAGFSVGVVEKDKIIDGSKLEAGNVLIGLSSNGIHSNGYSLVRKLLNLNGEATEKLNRHSDFLGTTLGEALLAPTKIYVKPILEILKNVEVKAISHITGGGFIENIPRMLPKHLHAKIDKASFPVPNIFSMLGEIGKLSERDMFNTFNMGIGMIFAIDKNNVDTALKILAECGEDAYVVGEVESGENGVSIC